MSEPTVTVKFTETELKLVNEMIGHHIAEWQEQEQLNPAKYNLQKELIKIEKWIADEKHEALTNKKASKESFKEQTKMDTSKRVCVPCED